MPNVSPAKRPRLQYNTRQKLFVPGAGGQINIIIIMFKLHREMHSWYYNLHYKCRVTLAHHHTLITTHTRSTSSNSHVRFFKILKNLGWATSFESAVFHHEWWWCSIIWITTEEYSTRQKSIYATFSSFLNIGLNVMWWTPVKNLAYIGAVQNAMVAMTIHELPLGKENACTIKCLLDIWLCTLTIHTYLPICTLQSHN